MRALIVDDEKNARASILQAIKLYTPQLQVVGEAAGVTEALTLIEQVQPELLFLDIQLKDGNGFDIVRCIDPQKIAIIFVTAYNEYALKALKAAAVDYLMKPIDSEELIAAVQKAQQHSMHQQLQEQLQAQMNLLLLQMQEKSIQRISLKTADSIHIVPLQDIIYCQGDRGYTTFHLKNQPPILISKHLKEYEALLPKTQFFRSHQSYLINIHHILRYDKGDQNQVILSNKDAVPVAVRKKEQLLQVLKQLS